MSTSLLFIVRFNGPFSTNFQILIFFFVVIRFSFLDDLEYFENIHDVSVLKAIDH